MNTSSQWTPRLHLSKEIHSILFKNLGLYLDFEHTFRWHSNLPFP